VVEVQSPLEKEDMTTKILKKQLKEAHDEIVKLREENKHMKKRIAEHLDLCEKLWKMEKGWSRGLYPYKNK